MTQIADMLRFLKRFGYKSISQVGGLKKAKALFTSLKEMHKEGGMLLCKKCLKRKIGENTKDPDAIQKSIDSGMYKKAAEGVSCFLCENEAEYIISTSDALGAVKKRSQHKYPGGDNK